MKFVKPDFLIIGLENGAYHGWTLTNNSFQSIETHKAGITSLHLRDDFFASGDRAGIV
jgi:hypothetical protein